MAAKPSYYDLLGLPQDATAGEVRQAYHDAALQYHPDVNPNREATDRFILIQEAYETLSDLRKRQDYDRERAKNDPNPIRVEVLYSTPSIVFIDEPQIVYTLLSFTPSKLNRKAVNPAVNICLMIDRSTSMQGARLDAVKDAAVGLLRLIQPNDQIAIVTFSDRAEVLAGAMSLSDRGKVEAQVQMIRAGGGTEMYQGLDAGLREVQRFASRSRINHMILITDGRTYGDEAACLQLAELCGADGIRITGMGLGTDWNDVFMDKLAGLTGGASYFVARTGELRRILTEKFKHLKSTFANNVTLSVKPAAGARLASLYRISPEPVIVPVDQAIRLGSIPQDTPLSLLLEFQLDPVASGTTRYRFAEADLTFDLPSGSTATEHLPIQLSRLTSSETALDLPPAPIYQALAKLNLYKMQERAREDVTKGKIKEAGDRLQRLATELLRRGEMELAQTAIVEAERIQQTQMLSAEGEKQIKYGTRALLPATTS